MLLIVSKMTITTSHATLLLFLKRGFGNSQNSKKGKNHLGDLSQENMHTVEESNLSSVMFVVFLLLHNAIVLENFLLLQELASIQRWASKNISKSVTFWNTKICMQKCLFDKRVKSPTVQCQLPFEYIHRVSSIFEHLFHPFSARFIVLLLCSK